MTIHKHHRKRRSQGGSDDPVNIIGLPDFIHQWVHENVEQARQYGLLVESWQNPGDVEVTIPEEAVKKPRKKRSEPAKPRQTFSIKAPKKNPAGDSYQEDGVAVLRERLERLKHLLCPLMGWDDDVSDYFPLVVGLDKGIEAIEDEIRADQLRKETKEAWRIDDKDEQLQDAIWEGWGSDG